ncbi:TolC family outer membrane protein [Kaarinaea lacus]
MRNNKLISSAILVFAFWATPGVAEDLLEIYQLALENDPALRSAEARKRAVYEAKGFTDANYFPSLDLVAGASYVEADTTESDSVTYGVNLSQPIYNRSFPILSRQAKNDISQADAEFAAVKQDFIITVASRYLGVLSALDNVVFSKAEQESIGRQLEQTKQRFEVGLVAITDVHEAQARYDLSVANTILAENQLDNARESLRTITGQYHNNLAILSDKTPFVARPDPDDIESWTETALTNNLSLQAIQYRVNSAREELKLQRADYFPTLNLNAGYNSDSIDSEFDSSRFNIDATDPNNPILVEEQFRDTSSTTTDTASVRLSFSLNIYSGGRTSTAVRQANEFLTQALEDMEETRREVQRRTRNGYLGVISGISRVQALKQAVVSNESALKAAEAGFEVGTRTTVEVLNARSILFSAINNHAQARYEYILAWLELLQAAGTLEEDALKRINQWLEAAPEPKSSKK